MEVKTLKGVALASIAGICWGSMGVAAQYLMANCQFTVLDLTSIRLLGAGILLVLLDIFWNRTRHVKAVFQKENLKDILVYGFALLCSQSTFFMSISSSNAATATIMVLTSPLFIIAYLAVAHHRRIKVLEMICLVLAMIGVILIITKGNWDTMDFSVAGVAWGLLSAMLGAVGTIQPGRVVRKLSLFPVIGWAMTFSGAAACLYNNPLETNVIWSTMGIICYLHIVLCGTIVSFCCFLKSMEFIAPPIASMLTCFEPLSAVVLSVILLGASFGFTEALGAVCILMTVFLLARSKMDGVPTGIRTPVPTVKGSCPRPLDDGDTF